MRKRYTAVYERDAITDAWNVEVAEEPRCHSWGRTLPQARAHIREALTVWLDTDESKFEIRDDIRLPAKTRDALARMERARVQARRAHEGAASEAAKAAKALLDAGLSMRDAGAVLGVSHQRVAQLVAATQPAKRRGVSAKRACDRVSA